MSSFLDKFKEYSQKATGFLKEKFVQLKDKSVILKEIAEIKLKEKKLLNEIEEQYKQIGKHIYEKYNQKTETDKEFLLNLCKEIDQLNEELEKVRKQLEEKNKALKGEE